MSIQAFGDLFKFESLAEQLHVTLRLRRVWQPEDMPAGPALQRQNAMSYCDFREMKHMVDCVLRKPRCAALLREWAAGAAAGRSTVLLIEDAQEIRKVLVENVMWRWWWQEMLSHAQAEVVCLILFRTLGLPSEFCRRLVVCHNWMVAYFRPSVTDIPYHRLHFYGGADHVPEEFLGDACVAADMSDDGREADQQLACRVVRTLPLLRQRLSCWNPEQVMMPHNIAYFLNEDEGEVERICYWLLLALH